MKQLRKYQKAINGSVATFIASKQQRAQVYSPTGSGKTECFIHTINDFVNMVEQIAHRQLRILIGHPRIALSQEQLKRFKNSLGNDRFHYTSFHSGQHSKIGGEGNTEGNTTSPHEVNVYASLNPTRHQVVFSSYHSIDKLNEIQWDLIICDEAHNLANDSTFEGYAERLHANKIIFYTATPVWSHSTGLIVEDDNSMSNTLVYGECIHELPPIELIREGYIVPPAVHFQNMDVSNIEQEIDPIEAVIEAYQYQHNAATKFGMPYHQMLVATKGRSQIVEINNNYHQIVKRLGDITVVTIMSDGYDEGSGVYINGRKSSVDRFEAIEMLHKCGNAIVCHYDTLSEGIDVSTLTGSFIMRGMTKVKLLQTIGRCSRPYYGDLDSNGNPIFLRGMDAKVDVRKKRFSVVTFLTINGQLPSGGIISNLFDITDAFAAGGYGDLAMYMESKYDETGSNTYDPTGEQMPTDRTMAQILDCQHELFFSAINKSGMYKGEYFF